MSMNRVTLLGRLGNDPDVRYVQDGTAVANFSLATSEKWKDKKGDLQEKTEWHKCVAWGKQGENIGKYFSKGSEILVEGSLQTRSWEDKEGNKRYTTEVKVNRFSFTGGSKTDNPSGGQAPPVGSTQPEVNNTSTDNDDIPF